MKKTVLIIGLLVILKTQIFPYKNALNFFPLAAMKGMMGLSFEHKFHGKNAVAAEGFFENLKFRKNYGYTVCYRRYRLNQDQSRYWGIFFRKSDIRDEIDGSRFSAKTICIGPQFGKKWTFGSRFNFSMRIGYGIPSVDFKWLDEKPSDGDSIEDIYKLVSGFDGELSLGICF